MVAHALTPALRRKRQAYFSEFKTSLVYIVSSRPSRVDIRKKSIEQLINLKRGLEKQLNRRVWAAHNHL